MRTLFFKIGASITIILTAELSAAVYDVTAAPYSANGGDLIDDTAAFNMAFAALALSGSPGTIYIPAGRYILSSKLSWTVPNTIGISIKGDGPGATQLRWTSATDGLQITYTYPQAAGTSNYTPVTVSGIAFTGDNSSAGYALTFVGAISDRVSAGPQVFNCIFDRANMSNGWRKGVVFDRVMHSGIDRCQFVGYRPGYMSDGGSSAIHFAGTGDDPVVSKISNINIYGFNVGIRVDQGVSAMEGMYVSNFDIVGTRIGISFEVPGAEEQVMIRDGHIAAQKNGIVINNCWRVWISAVNIFRLNNEESDFNGIYLSEGKYAFINNNFIRGSGSVSRGIVLSHFDNATINNNLMESVNAGIWLTSGSDFGMVYANQFYDSSYSRTGSSIIDSGVDNKIFNNF